MLSAEMSDEPNALRINPLVDYSEDFVGDYDPNLLRVEDLEELLNSGEDVRDPYALQRLRSNGGLDLESVQRLNDSTRSANTVSRNRWAVRLFDQWRLGRGLDVRIPIGMLSDVELNEQLPIFIHEAIRKDGQKFPPGSLMSIVAGLQQTICESHSVDLLHDSKFSIIRKSTDAAMKLSLKEGRQLKSGSSDAIMLDEEERLWQKVLGDGNPLQLVRTLFYLNGLHFALRGGEEHSGLTMEQFSIQEKNGQKCLVFKETTSKTNQGGLKCRRIQPKEVIHFANESNPDRCHVRIFERFLSVRPTGSSRFYLQPAKNPARTWYTNRPIGKNQLCKFVADMCSEAGISGRKTNHSLRATCATRLYHAGVDEQLIMERTGHRSVSGVRYYKRTSDVQIAECSAVLDGKQLLEAGGSAAHNFVFNNCTVTINVGK